MIPLRIITIPRLKQSKWDIVGAVECYCYYVHVSDDATVMPEYKCVL